MTTSAKSPERKSFNFGEQLRKARSKMESRFAAVISEEDKSFDPEALLASIRDQLIAERREMVLKLLGFKTSWGELEFDTSSRVRGSLQSFVESAVAKATQRWVDENPDFFDKAIQEAMKNTKVRTALRKSFTRNFNWRLEQAVDARAEALASEEADKFYNEAKAQLSLAAEES